MIAVAALLKLGRRKVIGHRTLIFHPGILGVYHKFPGNSGHEQGPGCLELREKPGWRIAYEDVTTKKPWIQQQTKETFFFNTHGQTFGWVLGGRGKFFSWQILCPKCC